MGDRPTQAEVPDRSTAEPAPRRFAPWLTWLLWLAFFIFVVYPLSIGPACKLSEGIHHSTGSGRVNRAMQFVYGPLITLIQRYPNGPIDNFYYWYLTKVWKIPPSPPSLTDSTAASGT